MENIYFKLLEQFEKTGLSSKKSISPFMEKYFDKPTATDLNEWNIQNESARLFIRDVKNTGHFDFDPFEDYDIGYNHEKSVYRWYDVVNINARITIAGLAYLEAHKTNIRTTKNSDLQTFAIALTVILTGVTLIVTLQNSNSDAKVDSLQRHIREQTQQLHTLQIELSQATNELYLEKEAKKTSPKNP